MRARQLLRVALLFACASCGPPVPGAFLFVWAGDAVEKASDFLAVIDADPRSPSYGAIVASVATGTAGAHPHHTEHRMPGSGHLLANGFRAGRTWLFDLAQPRQPKILTSFGDVGGFSHPHTFVRLPNGNVLATFQYAGGPAAPSHHPPQASSAGAAANATGGLVEMDELGRLVRSGSARDTAVQDPYLYPYSVLPLPQFDLAVSTTTDMDASNQNATSQWVQFWRLSDLALQRSVALQPGPRGDEHKFTGEPHLAPDGRSVYIHTFNCGLYLLQDVDTPAPRSTFVAGKDCGVPVLAGRHWLQPVPQTHAIVALDISVPERPRQVSAVTFGDDEQPHWIAIDSTGRRLVMNSAGSTGNRLFLVNFDPATGRLSIDGRFRDGGDRPGIRFAGKTMPHGFAGTAVPHGAVSSN
jgi:hypothetical protein